ncbi:helix-turn-helix domain-containing protein [Nocardia sp. NPDC057030]|uniref:helix-turn-helix domain-containing protein n=1 Tax=unclassified Nocardia TaxID=2637762 RepID=UPI00363C431C
MTDVPVITAVEGAPTVLRMMVGARLRRLREACGVSREDAGMAIRASDSKISRLELGRVPFRERDLNDLLTFYGFTDPEARDAFLTVARQANAAGWWQRDNDWLPRWFGTFVGLEQAAQLIRSYEPRFVPELLQTPDYAYAVLKHVHPDEPESLLERRVALQLRRQEILSRRDPPAVWFVVEQAALRCPFGGAAVWRAQLEYLIRAAGAMKTALQVLPDHVGGPAIADGPFTLLRFAEPEVADVVFAPQLTYASLLEKRSDTDIYLAVAARLSVRAAPLDDTERILNELLAAGGT